MKTKDEFSRYPRKISLLKDLQKGIPVLAPPPRKSASCQRPDIILQIISTSLYYRLWGMEFKDKMSGLRAAVPNWESRIDLGGSDGMAFGWGSGKPPSMLPLGGAVNRVKTPN